MRKLEKEFLKHGYTYKLEKREGNIAWYSQWTRDDEPILAGNEIFLVIVAPPKQMVIKKVVENLPEREIFPADEAFGITAWSVGIWGRDHTEKRFNEIVSQFKNQ